MTDIEIQNCIKRMEIRIAELGWSKEEFYEKSGVSSASYSQWNTGVHKPTKKKLAKAAAVLGISLEYLLTGEGQKNSPAPEGAELDAETIELREIWDGADREEREALLAMAKMLKARRNK